MAAKQTDDSAVLMTTTEPQPQVDIDNMDEEDFNLRITEESQRPEPQMIGVQVPPPTLQLSHSQKTLLHGSYAPLRPLLPEPDTDFNSSPY